MLFAGITVLVVVACAAILWFALTKFYAARPGDKFLEARGVITAPDARLLLRFPTPNLQLDPRQELLALQAREAAELNSYGWVDRTNGIVRIPVERAMELVLERGLPVRSTNAPARTGKSSLELIHERALER